MYDNREYEKKYITTAATSVVFSGKGTLGGVCVNTTAAGTIVLYDGSSPFASLVASIAVGTYLENMVIGNGLTVVTAGSPNITVKWVK
jgi:hypothetical protein